MPKLYSTITSFYFSCYTFLKFYCTATVLSVQNSTCQGRHQTRLIAHLALNGYKQCDNTPCLFKYATRDTTFSLVVDDFGVSYRNSTDAQHFITTLRKLYEITVQTEGKTYLGMKIQFNNLRTAVTVSIPGYIQKTLLRFRPKPY